MKSARKIFSYSSSENCYPLPPYDHSNPLASFEDELSRKQKVAVISRALSSDPVDVATLRQLAISRGGLVNDELRKKAWPKLLNVGLEDISPKPGNSLLLFSDVKSQI